MTDLVSVHTRAAAGTLAGKVVVLPLTACQHSRSRSTADQHSPASAESAP